MKPTVHIKVESINGLNSYAVYVNSILVTVWETLSNAETHRDYLNKRLSKATH